MNWRYMIISLGCFFNIVCATQLPPIDLTVKIHIGAGFFAELHKVIQTIIHFEKRGFASIEIDWRDEFFPYKDDPHENGWDLFFEPIPVQKHRGIANAEKAIIVSTADFHEMHDQVCTAPWRAYKQFLPYRQFIYEKLNTYARVKKPIRDIVDNFYDTHMKGKKCIGVHARIARAHAWLVPGKRLPQIEDYFKEVDILLEKHRHQNVIIFVASDSHQAIDTFKKRYGDRLKYIEAHRSPEDQDPCTMYTRGKYMMEHKDVWHQEKHGYFGGETTLLDCLLLSRCDYMIHTTSNLAFFAAYYNPHVESIYLPKGVPFKECRYKNDPSINNEYLNPS